MEQATLPMEELAPLLQLQLDNGGKAHLVVTGCSMHPTLRHRRDAVVLVPVTRPLKKADLILYRRASGQFVLHRIVTKPENGSFICSGDNQWEPEEVTQEQVIAVVETYIRKGKHLPVDQGFARFCVDVWVLMFPIRRPFLFLRRVVAKIFRRFRRKK